MNLNDDLPEKEVDDIIDRALAEDISHGDITSEALLLPDLAGQASLLVKEKGVLAGIGVAGRVFRRVDPSLEIAVLIQDGTPVHRGDIAGTVTGRVTGILKAERVALNFLQRLTGIASLTARYVAETRGTRAGIYDTRKTVPGPALSMPPAHTSASSREASVSPPAVQHCLAWSRVMLHGGPAPPLPTHPVVHLHREDVVRAALAEAAQIVRGVEDRPAGTAGALAVAKG